MVVTPIQVIFFDLGNTLVQPTPGTSLGTQFDLIDGAQQTLSQLKTHGVRLGLLSNTGDMTRGELFSRLPGNFNFQAFEDQLIILSSEVGTVKPQRRIFAHAIDAAGVAPVSCLFCTETLLDTLVAQEIGLRAIWLPTGGIANLHAALTEAQVI